MNIHPGIRALRRHKAGVTLIGLQIALTLAIVCNAMFIIVQRIERTDRATGVQEADLFLVSQQWVGSFGDDTASIQRLDTMKQEDVAVLRALPDVASVSPVNSLPLLNTSSWNGFINTAPETPQGGSRATFYWGDDQLLSTLQPHLIQGRAFSSSDVLFEGPRLDRFPAVTIVTQALAQRLFPHRSALGQTVFFQKGTQPVTIIGVIDQLQSPTLASWGSAFAWNVALLPLRVDGNLSRYAVRAKPGRMAAAMREAAPALYHLNPLRVLDDQSLRSFAEIRHDAYEADRGMAMLMGVVSIILLSVTAAGIVGLTSFWVGQRRRQIGVRRAIGARKLDILRHLQFENAVICGAGSVLGVALAIGLNLWLLAHYEMQRLPPAYLVAGIVLMLALGQAATLVPAWRASQVQPVEAIRA